MQDLLSWWFDWGAIVFLIATIFIAALVLFDMSRQRRTAMGWALGVILPIVIIFPSLLFKVMNDRGVGALGDTGTIEGLGEFFFWLGAIAGLVSVLDAIGYFMTFSAQQQARGGGRGERYPTIRGPGGGGGQPGGGGGGRNNQPPTDVVDLGGGRRPGDGGKRPGNAVMYLRNGASGGHQYQLFVPRTTIGRDPGSDIAINDPDVSREHALVLEYSGRFTIADRGSTNGTTVNDQPVRGQVYLEDNDVVGLGPAIKLLFKKF